MECNLNRTSLFLLASWSGAVSHYSLGAGCRCLNLQRLYAGDLVIRYVALLLRLMCPPPKRDGRAGQRKILLRVVKEKTVLSFVFYAHHYLALEF